MSAQDLLPGVEWHPSSIEHAMRPLTLGVVIHWTAGRRNGDLGVLDGPNVDCQFYVPKAPPVFQLLDPDEQGWHALRTANTYCIGIEHESLTGEDYTPWQLQASAELVARLCRRYSIPIRKVDPSGHDLDTFRGIFGHRDLSLGGLNVDGNDHTDTYPGPGGWATYITAVQAVSERLFDPPEVIDLGKLPKGGTLRLAVGGRLWAGWFMAADPLRWVARNGAKDPNAAIAWDGSIWRGPDKVTGVARNLVRRYLTA